MTVDELREIWAKYSGEQYMQFDEISQHERLSNSPDLHAFILLDRLAPTKEGHDLVQHASHDLIILGTDLKILAGNISEEQCVQLMRCGVRLSCEDDYIEMFV